MRNKLYAATFITFLLFSPLTQAASCSEDVKEMQDQINRHRSITTLEGHQIHQIDSVSGSNFCTAKGDIDGDPSYRLTWQMHNWGNTLHSYKVS